MSLRQITTFADGAEDAVVRTQMAWELASQHGAHLDAVVPARMPAPVHGTSLDLLSKGLDELRRRRLIEAHAVVEQLKSIAPSEHLHVCVRQFVDGELSALSASLGRAGDLVIVGQPDAMDRSAIDADILVGALLGSGRPCLMLPRWNEARPWGRRAFVAWKGTPEAARALSGALPLLRAAAETRVWIANPRSGRHGEDDRSLERVVNYLRLHGVKAASPTICTSSEAAETVVAAEIEDFGADLLVMGAYSRPRLQEIIFGGMTATMIREAKVPVLFAH